VDYFGRTFGSLVNWGDRRNWWQPHSRVAGCGANCIGRQSLNGSKDYINYISDGDPINSK